MICPCWNESMVVVSLHGPLTGIHGYMYTKYRRSWLRLLPHSTSPQISSHGQIDRPTDTDTHTHIMWQETSELNRVCIGSMSQYREPLKCVKGADHAVCTHMHLRRNLIALLQPRIKGQDQWACVPQSTCAYIMCYLSQRVKAEYTKHCTEAYTVNCMLSQNDCPSRGKYKAL